MTEKNPKVRTDTAEKARASKFLAFNCLTVETTLSIATINSMIPRNMCMFFVSSFSNSLHLSLLMELHLFYYVSKV